MDNLKIKTEWSLFWQGLLGEDDAIELKDEDPFETGKLDKLNRDKIKQITRALSSDRKKLNQGLEKLNKEIEEQTQKIDSLKLVGGDHQEALDELNKLYDLGQQLSDKLSRVDQRLKWTRDRDDQLRNPDISNS